MKIEKSVSIETLPDEILRAIAVIRTRLAEAETGFQEVHHEKIYNSYNKIEQFRRELYEIDLLSQELMDTYRLYVTYANHLMNSSGETVEEEQQGVENANS